MNEQMRKLRLEIEGTLNVEKDTLRAVSKARGTVEGLGNVEGWIEALEYVLQEIHKITEEQT